MLLVTISILLASVTSVSAGAAGYVDYMYISCYGDVEIYNYPDFSIPNYEEGITYDIPQFSCSSAKRIQIGMRTTQVEIGRLVPDTGGFSYICTLNPECCTQESYLNVCGNHNFRVYFFGSEGQIASYQNQSCYYLAIPPGAIRFRIGNELVAEPLTGTAQIETYCCYDCRKVEEPPATILYPKVDIETFSVAGGPTVIQDGKVISPFEMSPGSQQVLLQVENRGFFTQNDTRLRFEGLPEGVTVEVTPETQKITAHNLGTYSANFTLGPNVPSGTYQITMVAYSPNGMFDKITFEFIVP